MAEQKKRTRRTYQLGRNTGGEFGHDQALGQPQQDPSLGQPRRDPALLGGRQPQPDQSQTGRQSLTALPEYGQAPGQAPSRYRASPSLTALPGTTPLSGGSLTINDITGNRQESTQSLPGSTEVTTHAGEKVDIPLQVLAEHGGGKPWEEMSPHEQGRALYVARQPESPSGPDHGSAFGAADYPHQGESWEEWQERKNKLAKFSADAEKWREAHHTGPTEAEVDPDSGERTIRHHQPIDYDAPSVGGVPNPYYTGPSEQIASADTKKSEDPDGQTDPHSVGKDISSESDEDVAERAAEQHGHLLEEDEERDFAASEQAREEEHGGWIAERQAEQEAKAKEEEEESLRNLQLASERAERGEPMHLIPTQNKDGKEFTKEQQDNRTKTANKALEQSITNPNAGRTRLIQLGFTSDQANSLIFQNRARVQGLAQDRRAEQEKKLKGMTARERQHHLMSQFDSRGHYLLWRRGQLKRGGFSGAYGTPEIHPMAFNMHPRSRPLRGRDELG